MGNPAHGTRNTGEKYSRVKLRQRHRQLNTFFDEVLGKNQDNQAVTEEERRTVSSDGET